MTTKKKLASIDKAAGRTPSPVRPTSVRPEPPAKVEAGRRLKDGTMPLTNRGTDKKPSWQPLLTGPVKKRRR